MRPAGRAPSQSDSRADLAKEDGAVREPARQQRLQRMPLALAGEAIRDEVEQDDEGQVQPVYNHRYRRSKQGAPHFQRQKDANDSDDQQQGDDAPPTPAAST